MIRSIMGLLAGALAGLAVVFVIQWFGHLIWPAAGVDLNEVGSGARLGAEIPLGAKLTIILSLLAGGFAGAVTAGRVAGRSWPALAAAALLVCFGVATLLLVPQPVWMQLCAVAAPIAGGLIAYHLLGRSRAPR